MMECFISSDHEKPMAVEVFKKCHLGVGLSCLFSCLLLLWGLKNNIMKSEQLELSSELKTVFFFFSLHQCVFFSNGHNTFLNCHELSLSSCFSYLSEGDYFFNVLSRM